MDIRGNSPLVSAAFSAEVGWADSIPFDLPDLTLYAFADHLNLDARTGPDASAHVRDALPRSRDPFMTKDADTKKPKRSARTRRPTHARATANFEKLLQAAADVLADTGFEKLTSNEICARAGLTPPAFYHYFNNKYEVLEELADRLMRKQHDNFLAWFKEFSENGSRLPSHHAMERLFEAAAQIAAQEPSGMWTIRALRALPNLAHLRLKWQRIYSDQIFEAVKQLAPDVPPDTLWMRVRILVEFAYIIDELALEEDRVSKDILFREVGWLFGGMLEKLVAPANSDSPEAAEA